MINIFYSWQSDLPSSSNRNFIESTLKKAIESLKKGSEDIRIEMRVDTATSALSGSPDIAASIFDKISHSQIFICDVSIINKYPSMIDKLIRWFTKRSTRLTPNPNVLIELGYASHNLGWDRVICVLNTAQGRVEDLPFDIRNRRMCTYYYQNDSDSNSKEKVKKQLVGTFKSALIDIIDKSENVSKNIELVNVIIAEKFCESVNYLGFFLNYFLSGELGDDLAEKVVNSSICTITMSYDEASINSIVDIFVNKKLEEISNCVSNSGDRLSWEEFFISALTRIYKECENLLLKYGGKGDHNLIYKLEKIKDFSSGIVAATNSKNSSYMKETYSDYMRQKVYAEDWLKPYFLEIVELRIFAIQYLDYSNTDVKVQPKVLPGEKLKNRQ
ncbi:MAG: hypothetical protein V7L01_02965 [Nostoc sp.]|uniref:hypothetical protein n=1 Tax=Nostoc sp. TaxID=1180 RepID=UPI002FFB2EB7